MARIPDPALRHLIKAASDLPGWSRLDHAGDRYYVGRADDGWIAMDADRNVMHRGRSKAQVTTALDASLSPAVAASESPASAPATAGALAVADGIGRSSRVTVGVGAPVPVDSFHHGDKRANLPTADAQEFVTPEIESVRQILVDRDVSLDPQLVWRNKYGDESAGAIADAATLTADAPPIYIQEKIDPRVLVENLRRTARAGEVEPELTFFDTFDGLDALDNLEFYRHEANWSNRMILGDSLQVMGSLAEREDLRGTVQMIYIDPPYGIKFGSNWQASARKRDVKDGKLEDAAREAEQIKAFRDTWELGIHSYLSYLRDRLLVARELLTESGSCFVQIGDENVHLVRSLMDEVFGSENFISQISFIKTSGAGSPSGGTTFMPMVSDYLLWYSLAREQAKYRQPYEAFLPDLQPSRQLHSKTDRGVD